VICRDVQNSFILKGHINLFLCLPLVTNTRTLISVTWFCKQFF